MSNTKQTIVEIENETMNEKKEQADTAPIINTPRRNEGLSTELLFAAHQLRLNQQKIYGVTLQKQLLTQTGKEYSYGAIYTALNRMQKKSFFTSELGEPTHQRGGRRKRYYTLTQIGFAELQARIQSKQRLLSEQEMLVQEDMSLSGILPT